MAATRAQKIRLGVFALVAAALIAVIIVVFAGMKFWEGRDTYYVVIRESVVGLEVGADVRLQGVRIGRVSSVELSEKEYGTVVATLDVKEGLPIRGDTKAVLLFEGITGLKTIDLRGGTQGVPALPPGSTIPMGTTTLDMLQEKVEVLATQTTELMGRTSHLLDNLIALTDPAKFVGIDKLMANATSAAENLAGTSAEMRALVHENRAVVTESLRSVTDTAKSASSLIEGELSPMMANSNALVGDLRRAIQTNQVQVGAALADLRQASESFKEMARELRSRPSRLLFSPAPKERALP